MAGTSVLVDAGPIVAYLNRRDRHHAWAVDCWQAIFDPLVTCEAVFSEAFFLLVSEGLDPDPLLVLLERGIIRFDFDLDDNRADLLRLLRKYADRRMSVADACLVRMAELNDRCQVFTTDRDFRVYRRKGRHVIPLLSPFEA